MSTKVKGEAIKTGSIPLSALCSGEAISNRLMANNPIGELNENNQTFDIPVWVNTNVVYITTGMVSIGRELTKNSKIELDGPGGTFVEWKDNRITVLNYKGMFGTIKVNLNADIAYPDWNAEMGHAGYIKNKPFDVGFNSVNWFYDDAASYCITPMISNKVKYEGVIYEIPDNDDNPVSLGDGSIALRQYPYYDDSLMYVICYGIGDPNDERLQNILFEVNTKLDEKFIPDTIARKSDIPNIDPVVWKYICNPIIIKEGENVPEDILTGEFDDTEYDHDFSYYKLKDFVCAAMFRYADYNDADTANIHNVYDASTAGVDMNVNTVFYVDSQMAWHRYDA